MTTKSTPTRVSFAPLPEYEVVWHGGQRSPSGQVGQLLPESHSVGSTWGASVERLKRVVDAANKRDVDG